jgi:ubiquinone/menaquinone biosynthesis C-methylase UbiE
VDAGLDPARGALQFSVKRDLKVVQATGETLPFGDKVFGAVLAIVTICFCDDPKALLQEAARVTQPGGAVILGFVPAGSAWGKLYAAEGAAGHHYYSKATFYSLEQLTAYAEQAGLRLEGCCSTLYQGPEVEALEPEAPRAGCDEQAGFIAAIYRHVS